MGDNYIIDQKTFILIKKLILNSHSLCVITM